MASVIYNSFKGYISDGTIDWDTTVIWCALVMTNTTCDTENDAIDHVGDFGTLDECDGANYVRKAVASRAVAVDDANDRAELDAADITWTALGNGTREIQGALIYVDLNGDGLSADDATNDVIAFIEFGATVNPGGGDFTIQWNAEGILQLT